ncbi:AraC family transcriptional regulator [Dactylosporangium sp. AC04546]|uniref:AraC family transcriptional regulator n=1 Tax=Dactylosporangium sp. AC04546 TaxID=2862460 RepID=UPI001EDF275B|nr:AraC family transcriptional regulator [Dactylosporangium sp. AC04546]WVK79899.1 AraC family transcriptional regulator [Dactylosporangium sp. AC04546]
MFPRHELEVPDPAPLAFAIGSFDWFGPMARAAFPHRHAFHEIVYLTRGAGTHVVDLEAHPLRPPQLFVVRPGQVHHWQDADGVDGWVLVFTDDAYPDAARTLPAPGVLRPGPAQARRFEALLATMTEEYHLRPDGFAEVLPALLHVLVLQARRLGGADGGSRGTTAAARIAADFGRLLARPALGDATVRAFAARLGVSTSHLTEAVKASTGEPPGRLIRRAQALEARRLLARTTLTVTQVARAVGFADPAYFCRFFRREVGVTPGRFRGMHQDSGVASIDQD